MRCTLMVDVSASMQYGSGPLNKYEYAATVATSLAYLLLKQHDTVACYAFDETIRTRTPLRSTQAHLKAIIQALDASDPQNKTDTGAIFREVAEVSPRRGMITVVSDMLGDVESSLRGLRLLRQRGHDVMVLHVMDDDELDFPFEGPTRFEGLELPDHLTCNPRALREGYLEALDRFLTGLRRGCAKDGIDYALIRTSDHHRLPLGERRDVPSLLAWQAGLTAFALTGYYLWQGAFWTWTEGQQPIGGMAMAAMPIGFAGVAYFNARYWFRRVARSMVVTMSGWLPVAVLGSGILVIVAAIAAGSRNTGGDFALEGDKNVVLVTVDGLRRDWVGALGGGSTPELDALARSGVTFTDAVTPTPGSRAANASALVGRHPLRHGVFDDDDVLSRGYRSVFEALQAEGWATGGFVSSRIAASGSGLDQGFLTYDDDFFPALAGISRINLLRHVLDRLPAGRAALDQRDAAATVGRFLTWLPAHSGSAFAAWIHLSDPHQAVVAGSDPTPAVAAVDAAVGRVVEALRAAEVDDTTMVLVAGTHGELMGAHGGQINRTLFDEVVRVPMVIRAPGLEVGQPVVDAQVRLYDVPNTVVDWLQLDRMDDSEGVDLGPFMKGKQRQTMWCPLIGQDLDGAWLLGMRNNGLKYTIGGDATEQMFTLDDDPAEATNIVAEQFEAAQRARTLLAADLRRMRELLWD